MARSVGLGIPLQPLLMMMMMMMLEMVSGHVDALTQFVTECPAVNVSQEQFYRVVCVCGG